MLNNQRKTANPNEKMVLNKAKEFYGRSWRKIIYHAWMSGDYLGFTKSHLLQSIRNDSTRAWTIDRVKISE